MPVKAVRAIVFPHLSDKGERRLALCFQGVGNWAGGHINQYGLPGRPCCYSALAVLPFFPLPALPYPSHLDCSTTLLTFLTRVSPWQGSLGPAYLSLALATVGVSHLVESQFLGLALLARGAGNSLVWEAAVCLAGCLAASLVCTQEMLVVPHQL